MRLLLTLAVFALDVWAVVNILGSAGAVRSKVKWIVVVIALPVAGFLAWWLTGRSRSLAGEST